MIGKHDSILYYSKKILGVSKSNGTSNDSCKMNLGATQAKEQNWKVFRKDTECGRLLSRLYGSNGVSCNVSYPKLKSKIDTTSTRAPWGINIACKENKDGNTNKQRAASVRVPKVGKVNRKDFIHKLSSIPRLKCESACRNEVQAASSFVKTYRPPNKICTSSEMEKDRLSSLFEKGGKCLPEELTALPFKDVRKKDQPVNQVNAPSKSLMANQIFAEIQERRKFQEEMEINGAGQEMRAEIVNDITGRMKELMALDQKLAMQLMRNGS